MLCYYLRITGRGPLALVLTLGLLGGPEQREPLERGKRNTHSSLGKNWVTG